VVFAWYTLTASLATAAGSLAGGLLIDGLTRHAHMTLVHGYRAGIVGYASLGGVLLAIFSRLSPRIEVAPAAEASKGHRLGLARSHGIVLKLSALFALDAFGGGFVIQSMAAYWFYVRFGLSASELGGIFCVANLLAGLSALAAAKLAARFGLIRTMVFTHLPSNILLILVPLMPNLPLALAVLFVRFSISQMDVPTRQSFVMAVVPRTSDRRRPA